MRSLKLLLASTAGMLAAFSTPALAQKPTVAELEAEVQALRAREQSALDRLEALERRLQVLESSAGLRDSAAVPDASQANMRGMGLAASQTSTTTRQDPAQAATQTLQPTDAAEPETRRAPAPTDAVEILTASQQNAYGSRFSLEPGLTYSHFTNARLNLSGFLALDAIFLGLISIDEVEADILTADLTARYGVTDRLQFDVNVPYIYRRSSFKSGGAGSDASALAEETVTTSGIGDVSAGISYRFMRETARRPDIVLNARVKGPTGRHPFGIEVIEVEGTEGNLVVPERLSTGTGVWGAAAGVSALKTIDPMVVFGSLTYFKNFGRHFDDLSEADGDQPGRARLGSAIQYGAGVAFALNDTSSLSMSFTQRFVRGTRVRLDSADNWLRVIGSNANVGILNLGASFSLTDRIALLTNFSAGVTDDAPDMTVNVRVPYRF